VSDDQIRKAVQAAFLFDPRVYSFEPEVSVRDGVATLSGTVDNLRAKRAAAQDARNTVGVWRVRDYLRVRTPQPPTEAEIVKRVASALERNPYLVRSEIRPVAINQKVYLYGTVNSEFEREQAETATASVNGVVAIDNFLEVAPALARREMLELQQEIEDALWWNPFVDASHVRVAVDGETIVLDGKVDSWREWTAASKCARSCGAEHVRNRLRVGDSMTATEH